jgi:hypothetical protein
VVAVGVVVVVIAVVVVMVVVVVIAEINCQISETVYLIFPLL